jgi:hypothetical protein
MSALPSPLKSLVPIACQLAPGLNGSVPPPTGVVPFISQTAGCPSLFCHRMSGLPSLLKSPAAITCQDAPGFGSVTVLVTLPPFISQICGSPSSFAG